MLQRVMMIAGEPSGDLHGSGVVRELRKRLPGVDIFGVGGERMRSAGMELIEHIDTLSFMGFAEVLKNLGTVNAVMRTLERLLDQRRPDVLVLIDYPGFNLRFARVAKRHGVKILYYISPQVWAWHRSRVKKMKGVVDKMMVVFPFEVDFYTAEGIDVEFVGHPLIESFVEGKSKQDFLNQHGLEPQRKVLGLLPGSRKQEIEHILPTMIAAARILGDRHDIQTAIGIAPGLSREFIGRFVPAEADIRVLTDSTHGLMQHADALVVTSGTATLESGWFGTPMVVVYRTSPLTYFIGRMLVDVAHIGLVNIVAGKRVVPELIQHQMTPESIGEHVSRILDDTGYAQSMKNELGVIRERLGGPGASARVAEGIIELGRAA